MSKYGFVQDVNSEFINWDEEAEQLCYCQKCGTKVVQK